MTTNNISTRKMTDALDLLKSAAQTTEVVAFVSRIAVQLFDAQRLPSAVLVSAPDDARQAMEIVDTLLRTGTMNLIVVDAELCGGLGFAKVLASAAARTTALVLAY